MCAQIRFAIFQVDTERESAWRVSFFGARILYLFWIMNTHTHTHTFGERFNYIYETHSLRQHTRTYVVQRTCDRDCKYHTQRAIEIGCHRYCGAWQPYSLRHSISVAGILCTQSHYTIWLPNVLRTHTHIHTLSHCPQSRQKRTNWLQIARRSFHPRCSAEHRGGEAKQMSEWCLLYWYRGALGVCVFL